jgi:hypothetical protein
MLRSPMRGAVVAVLIVSAARPSTCFSVGGGLTGAGITAFLGWAFQGVGPSQAAKATIQQGFEPETVGRLNALLFGGPEPVLALFCGAKIRRESYAPLAQDFLEQLGRPEAGVLILQSPFNIYAFKPSSVTKVLNEYPSVECVAGHSIGGLWAAEFCRDLHAAGDWPSGDLSFFHMGVHGKGVSLKPFKELPFRRVGWSYASEDCTLLRAAGGAQAVAAYVEGVRDELPTDRATVYEIPGGNHEQYGSYGSPGFAQGLAYESNPATISEEEQRSIVASALVATMRGV